MTHRPQGGHMTHRTPDDGDDSSVFVPLTHAQWRQLVADTRLTGPLPAYGITAGLLAWGEFGADDTEDAMFAAQTVAGVAVLTLDESDPGARRLVIAVPGRGFAADEDSALGAGAVDGVELARVTAVFSDAPGVSVAEARQTARGLTPAEAWDHPVVAAFSDTHDLGWHTVAEATTW